MSTWRPIPPPRFWQRWLPERLHRPAVWLSKASIIGLIFASAFGFFYFLLAMRFNLDEVARLPADPVFYDRSGKTLPAPAGAGRRGAPAGEARKTVLPGDAGAAKRKTNRARRGIEHEIRTRNARSY